MSAITPGEARRILRTHFIIWSVGHAVLSGNLLYGVYTGDSSVVRVSAWILTLFTPWFALATYTELKRRYEGTTDETAHIWPIIWTSVFGACLYLGTYLLSP